ncbi:MAG: metallophosphatase family protein [Coriobacteriia bacterium]|nr:metallophosphatase family protein [Coriobacteriia bacterium]
MSRSIGLISDTHGRLPEAVLELLRDCQLIIHAGDIGSAWILDALELIAPVTAVLGNNDRQSDYPGLNWGWRGEIEGTDVFVTHTPDDVERYLRSCTGGAAGGAGAGGVADGAVAPNLDSLTLPQICIHGHTHMPRNELLYGVHTINPGAVTFPRGGTSASVARLQLNAGRIERLDFLPLS